MPSELKPAREVAHNAVGACLVTHRNEQDAPHSPVCDRVTAAIEADRAARFPSPERKLIESAYASGREVFVTTYHDGVTPIKARLLFHHPDDARAFVAFMASDEVDAGLAAHPVKPETRG